MSISAPSPEEPPSWVPGAAGSGFDVDHLPYGVFEGPADGTPRTPRAGVRIGDRVLDLAGIASASGAPVAEALFARPTLNAFLAQGREVWTAVRGWVTELLTDPARRDQVEPHLHPVDRVTLRLPIEVGDYVDFYASEQHASNVGRIFRPDQPPLLPNWKHLPVGYHGRAGTVVVSGTPIIRPLGQRNTADGPVLGPSTRLDIEAELGFVAGVGSQLGQRVPTAAFAEHTFGVVGLNDWSARDIQAWESVPLGPFLGKSFATSVSAWVTPLDALAAAWCELPGQDGGPDSPEVLDYLRTDGPAGLDVDVEVELNGVVIARPPYQAMYWGPAQMLAHLTLNGASLRTGDLWGSGTISGPGPGELGSLLELSWGWRRPFPVGEETRTSLVDGDVVTLRYRAPSTRGGRITLGEVTGEILAAR
ncbi:MAG: fumarylacetoacetase [Nocardioides sp.]|uniref:fumarylacetoacetase n=1 Tax=Nocardioides sp. TaxID=35761 RepID=UPI0039E35794